MPVERAIPRAHSIIAVVVTIGVAGLLTACGGSGPSSAAVRVGKKAISEEMVTHWMSVSSGGTHVSAPTAKANAVLLRGTVSRIILGTWLAGEAASQGLLPSSSEVSAALQRKEQRLFPGNSSERSAYLVSIGETRSDLEFEERAELAAAALRRRALLAGSRISDAAVSRYYRDHTLEFTLPERRQGVIANAKTFGQAEQVRLEVERAKSIRPLTERHFGYGRFSMSTFPGARTSLEHVIYKARPHALTGPFKAGIDYYLIRVNRTTPQRHQSFAEVEGRIRARLVQAQRQWALSRYTKEVEDHWRAVTDCQAGYLVPECSQYRGAGHVEGLLDFH